MLFLSADHVGASPLVLCPAQSPRRAGMPRWSRTGHGPVLCQSIRSRWERWAPPVPHPRKPILHSSSQSIPSVRPSEHHAGRHRQGSRSRSRRVDGGSSCGRQVRPCLRGRLCRGGLCGSHVGDQSAGEQASPPQDLQAVSRGTGPRRTSGVCADADATAFCL
jgi:hypothetical protein